MTELFVAHFGHGVSQINWDFRFDDLGLDLGAPTNIAELGMGIMAKGVYEFDKLTKDGKELDNATKQYTSHMKAVADWADASRTAVEKVDPINAFWEGLDKHVMEKGDIAYNNGLDKTGTKYTRGFNNMIAKENADVVFENTYSWTDPESSVLSGDFAKYLATGVSQIAPQLTAQIASGRLMMKGAGLVGKGAKYMNATAKQLSQKSEVIKKTKTWVEALPINQRLQGTKIGIDYLKSMDISNKLLTGGIAVYGTIGEGNMIADQAKKTTIDYDANRIGGKAYQKDYLAWEMALAEKLYEQGKTEAQINAEIEIQKSDYAIDWLTTNKPEKLDEVLARSEQSARTALRANSGMILTNLVDANAITGFAKYNRKLKALGKSKYSRQDVKKATRFGDAKQFTTTSFTEGVVEEAGFNKYAEWKAEAEMKGETFDIGQHIQRAYIDMEAADDMFLGALGGGGMSLITNMTSYKSRKEAWAEYDKAVKEYEVINTAKTIDDLKNISTTSKSASENQALLMEIEQARGKGEHGKADLLEKKFIHNQALRAFKSGSTESLLDGYNQLIENNPDPEVKLRAKESIQEILELEKIYNESQEFLNSDDVYVNTANRKMLEKSVPTLDREVSNLTEPMNTSLTALNESYDASYSINKDGTVKFTGKQADEFKAAAMNNSDFMNYNTRINDKHELVKLIQKLETSFDKLTSPRTQKTLKETSKLNTIVNDNKSEYYGSENVEEFEKKINKLLSDQKYKFTDVEKEDIKAGFKDSYLKTTMVEQLKKRQQEIEESSKSRSGTITDARTSAKSVLASKTGIDESIADEQAEGINDGIINETSKIIESVVTDENMSFDEFIGEMIGDSTDKQYKENKADTEEMFQFYSAAWRKIKNNQFSDTEKESVRKKYFTPLGGKKDSIKDAARKAMAATKKTKKDNEAKETTTTKKVEDKQPYVNPTADPDPKTPPPSPPQARVTITRRNKLLSKIKDSIGVVVKIVNSNYKFIVNERFPFAMRLLNNGKLTVNNIVTYSVNQDPSMGIKLNTNTEFDGFKSESGTFMVDKFEKTTSTGRTTVTQHSDGSMTFVGEQNNRKVPYKRYNHIGSKNKNLPKDSPRNQKYRINDEFFFTDDSIDTELLDNDIEEVRLYRATDTSLEIEIVYTKQSGKQNIRKQAEIANEYDNNNPIFINDTDGIPVGQLQNIYNVAQQLRDQSRNVVREKQRNIIEYRKRIVAGDTTMGKIKSKDSTSYIASAKDDALPIMEQDDKAIIVVMTQEGTFKLGETLFENPVRRIQGGYKISNNGTPYELRKMGEELNEQGEVVEIYKAFTLNPYQPLTQNKLNAVVWGLKAFFDGKYGTPENSLFTNDISTDQELEKNKELILSMIGTDPDHEDLYHYIRQFVIPTINSLKYKSTIDGKVIIDINKILDSFNKVKKDGKYGENYGKTMLFMSNTKQDESTKRSENSRLIFITTLDDGSILHKELTLNKNKTGFVTSGKFVSPEEFIATIAAHGHKLKHAHNTNSYADGNTVPNISTDGTSLTPEPYSDMELKSRNSNIEGHTIVDADGNESKATGTNPIIEIDMDSEVTESEAKAVSQKQFHENTKKTDPPAPELTNNTNIKTDAAPKTTTKTVTKPTEKIVIENVKNVLAELGVQNIDMLFNDVDEDISEEQLNKIKKRLEKIEGVNPSELNAIVMNIMNNVINLDNRSLDDYIASGEFEKELQAKLEEYQEVLAALNELNDPKYNNIINILTSKLTIFDQIFADLESDNSILKAETAKRLEKYDIQEEDTTDDEVDKIYGKESVEYDGKKSIARELKEFFAGIPITDIDGKPTRGFLGLPEYMEFDTVLNIITSIVGSQLNTEMNIDDVIALLGEFTTATPFLESVIEKLKAADHSVKTKLMKHVTKHNMSMKFVYLEKDGNDISLRVYNTNTGEIVKILQSEWEQNFLISEYVDIDGNINIPELMKFRDEYNTIRRNKHDYKKISEWLLKIGVDLNPRAIEDIAKNGLPETTIKYDAMFNVGLKTSGFFGGLVGNIDRIISASNDNKNTVNVYDGNFIHPFTEISSTKKVAKVETKYNDRVVTIAFRTGGKNVSGYIPPKFATDRIEDLKQLNNSVKTQLLQDPFSSSSLLLQFLNDPALRDDMSTLLNITHVDLDAMKVRGVSDDGENALSKLNPDDQYATQVGFFQDLKQGKFKTYKGIPMRVAEMFFPTMSDKKQMLALKMPVFDFTTRKSQQNIQITDDGVKLGSDALKDIMIEQLVMPELKRIAAHYKRGDVNITGYNNAAKMFLLMSKLNNITVQNNGAKISILEALRKGMGLDKILPLIRNDAIAIIEQEITKQTIQGLDIVITKDYGDTMSKTSSGQHRKMFASADFVINNLISYSNIFQLVAGDLAFYANDKAFGKFGVDRTLFGVSSDLFNNFMTYDSVMKQLGTLHNNKKISEQEYQRLKNELKPLVEETNGNPNMYTDIVKGMDTNIGKRLALLLAPGNKVTGIQEGQYIQLYLDDYIEDALDIEFLIELHYGEQALIDYKDGSKTKSDFPTLKSFFAIETTDAQEYTTLKEHLDILLEYDGKITPEQHKDILDKYEKGEEFDPDELKIIFQPIKPVHSGSTFNNETGMMEMNYIKTSSYPLLKQIVGITKLNSLREAMEKMEKDTGKNIRAVYKTGAKIGATISGLKPFSNPENLTDENLKQSSSLLDRRNFRIQQDTPVHALYTDDDQIKIGTQLMKILFGDGVTDINDIDFMGVPTTGRDLLNQYNDTYGELIDTAKTSLFNELGLDNQGYPIDMNTFIEKLSKVLKREATDRNYPQQDIDSLDISINEDGTLRLRNSIWLSTNSIRYESLLNSMITNRIVKMTLPGYSYIAGSRTGYGLSNDINKTDVDQSRMIYTDKWNGENLNPANTINNNKAQVFVPSRFRDSDGKIIDLFAKKDNEYIYITKTDKGFVLKDGMITDEMLQMTSFRIPTSSHVSASQVEIAGFLPPGAGDLMIVPSEFSPQKGLDYDVDKEFAYYLNHVVDENGRITSLDDKYSSHDITNKITALKKRKKRIIDILKIDKSVDDIDNVDNESTSLFELMRMDVDPGMLIAETSVEELQTVNNQLKDLKNYNNKILQNKLVRINAAIIGSTNPEIQKKVNKALSMDFADKQKDLMGDKNASFTTVLSGKHQRDKMNFGAAGAMGIGVYSNYVVMNSLFQQQEDSINLTSNNDNVSITIGTYNSTGMLGRYINILSDETIATIIKTDNGQTDNLEADLKSGRITVTKLENILKGTKNENLLEIIRPIADAFAEKQNTATDNEKEQIMGAVGVNEHTINVDSIMTLLGFDVTEKVNTTQGKHSMSLSYLLISQPIVKDYIEALGKRSSNVNPSFKTNKEIISSVASKYKGNPELTNDNITPQKLYDSLQNPNGEEIQQLVLELYLNLEAQGRKINDLQNLLGITKEGLGKDIGKTNFLYDELGGLMDSNDFSDNITDLFGEFETVETTGIDMSTKLDVEGYMRINDVIIKPTTMMGHLLVNSVTIGHNLAEMFFPYNNIAMVSMKNKIDSLGKQSAISLNQKIDLSRKVVTEFKKYINSIRELNVVNGDLYNERERLFTERQGESLAAYLLKLKTDKFSIVSTNALLKKLRMHIGDREKISSVKYDNTMEHNFDDESIYAAIIELLLDNTPLRDNKSIELPYSEMTNMKFYGEEDVLISKFKKSALVRNNNKGMTPGETKYVVLNNGDRMKIKYHGEKTIEEYNSEIGDFITHNGTNKNEWQQPTKEFITSNDSKHVFTFEPIYTSKKLMEDLISYNYLSGGQASSIDFTRYIPLDLLEIMGYSEYMNSIDVSNESFFQYISGMTTSGFNNFIVQYYQNNSKDLKLSKLRNKKLTTFNTTFAANEVVLQKDEEQPLIIKLNYKQGDMTRQALFVLQEGKKGLIYKPVPIIGGNYMSEYDVNSINVNSILNKFKVEPLTSLGKPVVEILPPAIKISNAAGYYDYEQSSKNILDDIANNRNDEFSELAKTLSKIKIKEQPTINIGIKNHFDSNTNTITLSETTANSNNSSKTFLHEYLHALTSTYLNEFIDHDGKPIEGVTMPKEVQALYDLFEEMKIHFDITSEKLKALQTKLDARGTDEAVDFTDEDKNLTYGFKNVKEFITAALTNEEFIAKLEAISGEELSFMDKIAEWLSNLVNKMLTDSNITGYTVTKSAIMDVIAEANKTVESVNDQGYIPPPVEPPTAGIGFESLGIMTNENDTTTLNNEFNGFDTLGIVRQEDAQETAPPPDISGIESFMDLGIQGEENQPFDESIENNGLTIIEKQKNKTIMKINSMFEHDNIEILNCN